ncbi:bifunctional UDP-N-acetylglucosamine diphosphorylase/glucosamine-1-phosphate N-acetyltransferase GlmU [Halobacteriovorax sp. HLS]|uniref:bifunctional UDP-N-acetylglucosamine diphosphorylase/glucosamine-1-phosphate N-acetyltransferase GlmU n=1 Tax=Halobacteriovorax sp. HLS TaxID=2234000 RepID=UPI000FDB4C18|nr:bifunctional UDP-N-acetylglucosamine diphosphorylase/glucosamine-1-phosphate N-acetyltransferase GlmU [Halobacteriovorax sp. HLS]
MKTKLGTVILSAGAGTRMKMKLPKPLAPFMGRCLVDFPIEEGLKLNKAIGESYKVSLVTGHGSDLVKDYVTSSYPEEEFGFAYQEEQLGTAHALKCYFDQVSFAKDCEYTLVLCADTPLINMASLETLYKELITNDLDGVAATFLEETPKGYGRIIRSKEGGFHIVEEKDADDIQRKVNEVNSGMYVLKTKFILDHLYSIGSTNKAGEFYLTDLFKDDYKVKPVLFEDKMPFAGVNDLHQLERSEQAMRRRIVFNLREKGVRFIDSRHTYIDTENIGAGSVIYPNVHIDHKSCIGEGVTLEAGSIIIDSTIEDEVILKAYSHLEGAILRKSSVVGPYARMRPGADIGSESKIGNFVEIKKSVLSRGVKVSHLSYVGDAEIGDQTNIGCGFITCNYDGANKHKTEIGENCFIGSDSQTVAPVKIGDNCFVASSSTITNNMPDGSFAISRTKQSTKEGMAKRFLKSK